MSKKMIALIVAAMLIFMVGCAGEPVDDPTAPTDPPADTTTTADDETDETTDADPDEDPDEDPDVEQVDLTWFMWSATDTETAQWEELADDVTVEYPHINITLETTDWDGYWTRLQTQLASNTTTDIISMQSLRAFGYYSLGGFQSLTPFIENDPDMDLNDFDQGILQGLSFDGEVLALPYDAGPRVIFYNLDLFDEKGVEYIGEDFTWDDFIEVGKQITDGTNYGWATTATIDQTISFIWGAGGRHLDENDNYDFTAPGTAEGLQFYGDLFNVHKIVVPLSDPGNPNFSREMFYTGTVGMINEGPWQATNIRANSDFRVGVAMLPEGPEGRFTDVAGSGFAMSSSTDYPEEVYKAIASITSTESLTKLALWGRGLPARISAMPAYYEGQGEMEGLEYVEMSSNFSKAMIGPNHWQEVQSIYQEELEALIIGQTTDAETILRQVTQRAQGVTDAVIPFD